MVVPRDIFIAWMILGAHTLLRAYLPVPSRKDGIVLEPFPRLAQERSPQSRRNHEDHGVVVKLIANQKPPAQLPCMLSPSSPRLHSASVTQTHPPVWLGIAFGN